MKEEFVFQERQYFQKWKAALFFVLLNIPLTTLCVCQIGFGRQLGNMSDMGLLVLTLMMVLFFLPLFFLRLHLAIDRDGVYMQMFPFQWKYKFVPWDHIQTMKVRKAIPLSEWVGGWLPIYKYSRYKLKYSGFHKKFLLANISGSHVLQLDLINNERIVIGTQRAEELLDFLEKLNAKRKQE